MSNASYILDGNSLSFDLLYQVANAKAGEVGLSIAPEALKKMNQSRAFVYDIVKKGEPVYGINTGFGALASKHIEKKDLAQLQLNLIRSHCTGVGEPFDRATSRAIMLLRANCLCLGHSGVNPELVDLLLAFINLDIIPVIPCRGSVGASGDLAPLSHIALALIGEGEVFFEGKKLSTSFVLSQQGLSPVTLGPKDGLALINGTAVMAALGALSIIEAQKLMKTADLAAAYTVEAIRGTARAYDPKISRLKPHQGQIDSAQNLATLLKDSPIAKAHTECDKVQDPYSLRCAPQVHGACRQTLRHCEEVFNTELNAVTDNPLIFVEEEDVISGGNFHGEAVAMAMDYLAIGVSELANISERRIEKMMNPTFSELPAFLVGESGLNSGMMIAHVTAAALVSENKIFCHPASVDSVPTSTDKEDHVSMGPAAGLKLLQVIKNTRHVLAIELFCAAQGLDFQRPLKSTSPIEALHSFIRLHVQTLDQDRVLSHDIEKLSKLIQSGAVIDSISSHHILK